MSAAVDVFLEKLQNAGKATEIFTQAMGATGNMLAGNFGQALHTASAAARARPSPASARSAPRPARPSPP